MESYYNEAFPYLDPDEPLGIVITFSTLDETIDFSLGEYGAEIDNFINAGMI